MLFDLHPQRYIEEVGRALGRPPAAVAQATFGSGLWQRAEEGEVTGEEFVDGVLTGLSVPIDAVVRGLVCAAWSRVIQLRPAAIPLLRRVRGPVAAWSNTNAIHAAGIRGHTDLVEVLGPLLFSCELATVKPRTHFYQLALLRAGRGPEQMVFVDDKVANVDAARALGIDAYLAASLPGVSSGLERRGLLNI